MIERQKSKKEADQQTHEVNEEGLPINCKFQQIEQYHLDRNEYMPNFLKKGKFEPIPESEVPSDFEESDDTDEEFDWYNPSKHMDESYFVFTNLNRRTLQPGEQAYYCYGNRSNKFLLANYGFSFLGNRYDSYSCRMKMRFDTSDLAVHKMVDFKGKEFTEEVRFKTNQFNSLLMSYLRSTCKNQFFQG